MNRQTNAELLETFLLQYDQLNSLFQQIKSLPENALLQKPTANAWSANECLKHLNSYGRYYLPLLEKSLQSLPPDETNAQHRFKSGWLGGYFAKLMTPDQKGVPPSKMQSPKDHRPSNNLDWISTLSEFEKQHIQLKTLLIQAKGQPIHAQRLPISISRFVRLKTGDVFGFYLGHHLRHLHQALRAAS